MSSDKGNTFVTRKSERIARKKASDNEHSSKQEARRREQRIHHTNKAATNKRWTVKTKGDLENLVVSNLVSVYSKNPLSEVEGSRQLQLRDKGKHISKGYYSAR